jgi:hypothetical protein
MDWKTTYAPYLSWKKEAPLGGEGVLVGSDLTQEWILPWWWSRYSKHNAYPVTFIDMGLSPEMKSWCLEHGSVIHLPIADPFIASQEEVDPALATLWENQSGRSFWNIRSAWFKKPIACLQTPYERSLWLDLDCEVKAPLDTLFSLCHHPSRLALSLDMSSQTIYNSGVIAFQYGCQIIEEWAHLVFEQSHLFAGDQDILSALILEKKLTISKIPPHYNWSRCYTDNPHAAVLHWHGATGKTVIAHQLQKENLDKNF